MAVLALAAGGAALGAQIAATTMLPLWLANAAPSIGWAAGQMLGNAAFGPKLPDQRVEGPRFADLRIQSSTYGQMVPIVFGTVRLAGNVIWASEVREISTTTSQTAGGGKGGGGASQTVTTTNYSYFVDAAFLLCEGEIAAVRRIWTNGELKYDVSASATTSSVAASAVGARSMRVYPGSETQAADPTIEAAEGADTTAYRGYAYVVFENLDVTPYGGKLPQIEFEVVASGSVAATLDISAGTTVGTSSTLTSVKALGTNGNVWYLGSVSNTAVMINYHTGATAATYTRTLWGYIPTGLSYDKSAAVFNNYGGYFGFLHPDGSVTEYSSAPGILGSNGVEWVNSVSGFAQGDSSSGSNFYRFTLDTDNLVVTETLLTEARSAALFRNACAIEGRCYVYGSTTYSHEVGYIATGSNSKVLLFSGTSYGAYLVSNAGHLWMARNSGSTNVEKRDQDGALIGSVTIPSGTVSSLWEAPDGTIAAYVGSVAVHLIHPTTLAIDQTSESPGTKTPLGFLSDGRLILASTSGSNYLLHEMERLPRVTTASEALSDVVTALCTRAGLTAGELDVSELAADDVRGYAIARPDSARSALEPLRIAFRFDALESDGQIVFRKRGQAVSAVIAEDDLAARRYGEDPPAKVESSRELETELPRELAVQFLDADAMYELGSQYARRLTGQAGAVEPFQLPLVMTAAEAAGAAEFLLYDRWISRNTQRIRVSRKWSHLEPADVVQFTADGITRTSRIIDVTDEHGVMALSLVDDDADVVSTAASGVSGPTRDQSVAGIGPSVLRVLDIPLLQDADDGAGCYVAACGLYDGWRGAELFVSRDAGVTWNSTGVVFTSACVIGSAVTALPNFTGGNVFDEISTVEVQVIGGALESATDDLVRSGTNTCYLGGELVSFKSATVISTGRYRLSGLRRGRKGTEQYMSTHAIGDPFVLLTQAKRLSLTTADIGASLLFKAVTFGQLLAEAAETSFTPAAVGLEPLAPVNIRAGRSAASAPYDITIAWTRRNRLDAQWRSYSDVPQSETTESYEVDIYSDSTFTTLKRTLSGLSSATATYTSAQQVTDFGSNRTTIYVKVYQVSATVGRGFAGTATITV